MSNWIMDYYKDSFNRGAKQGTELKRKHKKSITSNKWLILIIVGIILMCALGYYAYLASSIDESNIPVTDIPTISPFPIFCIVLGTVIVLGIISFILNKKENNHEIKE